MTPNARLVRKTSKVVPPDPLPRSFYDRATIDVARDLIGQLLVRHAPEGRMAGIIVETEAYGPDDPACHAFRGETRRNRAMFGEPGHAYVYRIYGVHWCLNAVTQPGGCGEAVLIRALEPTDGLEIMRSNRPGVEDRRLCRGPGALCAAFGITGALDGADLLGPDLLICHGPENDRPIRSTRRIGLTKAADRPWRFIAGDSEYVSGTKRLNSSNGE